jgi:hypothetical protein
MHGLVEGVQAIGAVEGDDAISLAPLREDEISLHRGPPEMSLMASGLSASCVVLTNRSVNYID